MHRILVIGVAENEANRRSFEDAFAAALALQNVEAVPSYQLLPGDARLSKASIEDAIRGRGFQGVLVTRLLGVDEQETYVPPSTYVRPSYYGRGMYGYYGSSWDVVHNPGYTVTETIVRLETHLYDARTADLVWAAHSDTFDPSSTDDIIDSVTKKLSGRLAEDGMLSGVAQ
jgi:predicted GNAT family acetyltransferase